MEICAYHESGHAVVALLHGAAVESISIDPDWDDGPRREGDVEVHWPRDVSGHEIALRSIDVALAGPVAELIYTGDIDGKKMVHPATVPEWSQDWSLASQLARQLFKSPHQREQAISRSLSQLYKFLNDDRAWQAVAALSDELLAHERLEREEIYDVVSRWLSL